jgi:hypothetical protein
MDNVQCNNHHSFKPLENNWLLYTINAITIIPERKLS